MLDCLKCWYGVYYPYCPCKEDEERQSGATDKEEVQGMDNPCIKCVSKQYCEETNGTCGDLEQYRRGEDDEG